MTIKELKKILESAEDYGVYENGKVKIEVTSNGFLKSIGIESYGYDEELNELIIVLEER